MGARRLLPCALAVAASLAATAAAQEPPALPAPDPVVEAPPRDEGPGAEDTVGPMPGAPTVSLGAAVAMALQRNFTMLGAADGLQSARIRHAAARADFMPKLTPSYERFASDHAFALAATQKLPWTGGSLAASAELRSRPGAETPLARSSDLRFELRQPLLRGFGPTAAFFDLTNRRRHREGQERSYELQRQNVAVQVATAFYQVIQQRGLLAVARQSLRRSQSLLAASESRLQVGLVSKLDVFRAQLQAAQAQESMVRSEASLESALERLRFLMGLPPTDPVEPEAAALPDELGGLQEPVELLVSRALGARLDLLETRDLVSDARRSASLARQNLLPQLDVRLSYVDQGFGPSFGSAVRAGDSRLSLAFTTSYPLDRANDAANKAVAEIEVAARSRGLRERELEIESEVRAAVRELSQIRKSVELQKQAVEVAEQQHRLATLRYQRGLASNFDVVEAEESLVLARTALVGLLTRYQVARVELLRVTGTLDVEREFGS